MRGLNSIKVEEIGKHLKAEYESGRLLKQVARLWGNLNGNPPFPYDWKDRSLKALLEIEAKYESRRRFATASISP